jgi:LCP family protein required for cell wall assembly
MEGKSRLPQKGEGITVRNRLFLSVIAVVFALGALTVYWWFQEGQSARPLDPGAEASYVLLLGLDSFGENERSDTIMVAKLEADGVKLLSIPRDLRVTFPDGTTHKINAAYARGGAELVRQLVSDRLDIPLHWYVVADYQGFIEVIDALGGVTLNVERAMQYEDTKQDLVIDIPAGEQTLSGQEALDYWRYRDAATRQDLGRIERQHKFLNALAEKVATIESFEQVRSLLQTALENVRTNIAFVDAVSLARRYQSLSPEAVQSRTLPGRAETITEDGTDVSYFRADPIETAALVEEFFKGKDVLTNSDVRVIVLNGHPDESVRPLLATRTSRYLSDQGFQIVGRWNAPPYDYQRSYLINVSGNDPKARLLANTFSDVPLQTVTPEAFTSLTQDRFGEDRLESIRRELMTRAIPPDDRGLELQEADLVLILGGGFTLDPTPGTDANAGPQGDTDN